MKMKILTMALLSILVLNGCTSGMANAYGGSLAGAAIQANNEQYSEKSSE